MSAARNYIIFHEEPIELPLGPELLVPWEPRWRSFRDSIGPALARAPRSTGDLGFLFIRWDPRWSAFRSALGPALGRSELPLEGECQAGFRPNRHTFASFLLHAVTLLVLMVLPVHMLRSERLWNSDPEKRYEVIYYAGEDLPRIEDVGGAQAGASGRSGGREQFHPTQAIRIARGNRLVDIVVDAPHLNLPRTNDPVANLLTMTSPDPGPAPAPAAQRLLAKTGVVTQPAPVEPPPDVARQKLMRVPDLAAGAINAPPEARRAVAGLRLPELGAAEVVPPPIGAPAADNANTPKLTLPMATPVAPPPQVSRNVSSVGVVGFGDTRDVVPPAPRLGGNALAGGGIPGGVGPGTVDVVPPPPQAGINGGNDSGILSGAAKALGSLLGSLTGSGGGSGSVVISGNPGTAAGLPGNGGTGSLAMSPSGGNQPGLGGIGGGAGIGNGTGTGSASSGDGPGSAARGDGFGSGAVRPGTSLSPGSGGSGNSVSGGITGATVRGGKVTIPGFSSPSQGPEPPSRSSADRRRKPGVTVIASARSGGALNLYGSLKGAKVYTIYLDTHLGMAVLQYAERSASQTSFEEDLMAPEAINTDVPVEPIRTRLLFSCILDQTGMLKNVRLLDSGRPPEQAARIEPYLERWRFRPVLRGEQPIDVDVIVGFNVDTR